jgi:hypothetical protein
VNINDHVWAKLTDRGMARVQDRALVKDGEYYRFQLWELMNAFGPICSLGAPSPFVGNEIFFTKQPPERQKS